jgi:hypothetical protein
MQPSTAPDADPLFEPTAQQWLIDMGGMALQTAGFVAVAAVLLSRSVLRTGPR